MKRLIAVLAGAIGITLLLGWAITWVDNGGWPSSGPSGEELPVHIQYVDPADGQQVREIFGFCLHFNYLAGHGLVDEPLEVMRVYFDGSNVTSQMVDIVRLEYGYPDPVGEPCYTRNTPLSPGWHTAKVVYSDRVGQHFEYKWRFQVTGEQ